MGRQVDLPHRATRWLVGWLEFNGTSEPQEKIDEKRTENRTQG